MEGILLTAPDTGEEFTVYVIEETVLNEQRYLLVAEDSEGDSEAFILKETATGEEDAIYDIVDNDLEFEAVLKIFMELVEDTDFVS